MIDRPPSAGKAPTDDHVAFLLDASRALGGSLDYEATLAQVADLAVPRIADWCAVALLRDDPGPTWHAVRCADPTLVGLADDIRRAGPTFFFDRAMVMHLLGSGQSLLFPRIDEAVLTAHVTDPSARELIRRLGLRSAIIVPLKLGDRLIGALALAQAESGRSYAERDLDLAADLASRAAMAAENARLYAEARRAIRVRDEFVSIAAHEIRAPLAGIRALVHTDLWHLNDPAALDPDHARQTLNEIDRLCQMLSRLLTHLLDASRIETGRFAILPVSCDLVSLVRWAVERARSTAPAHLFELQAPPALAVEADPVRVDQVLTNLLDNAVKFSPSGSTIEVALRDEGPEAVLVVRDHGVGVPSEHREHIFEPYYQAPGHRGTGLGLGLYIGREIVAQHGGQIAVEWPDDGGSRFIVRLPTRPGRGSCDGRCRRRPRRGGEAAASGGWCSRSP